MTPGIVRGRRNNHLGRVGTLGGVAPDGHHLDRLPWHIGEPVARNRNRSRAEGNGRIGRLIGPHGELQYFALVEVEPHGPYLNLDGNNLARFQFLFGGKGVIRFGLGRASLVQLAHRHPHQARGGNEVARAVGERLAVAREFLYPHGQVHVVVVGGRYPQVQLHVAGNLGRPLHAIAVGHLVAGTVRLIFTHGLVGRQRGEQGTVGSRQIEFVVLGTGQREILLGTAHDVGTPGIQHRQAYPRCLLPTVVDTLQVVVEEAAQILHILGRVIVEPLAGVVHPQPLLFRSHAAEPGKGAVCVHRVGIAGYDVGRNLDILDPGRLVFPIVAHEGTLDNHAGLVLEHAVGRGKGFGNHLGKLGSRYATPRTRLAVVVAESLPGSDGSQMLGTLGCNEPLRYGKPRVTRHAHLAVAPLLRSYPVNHIAPVKSILVPPVEQIALRHVGTPFVGVDNGIAMSHPIGRVGTFELLQPRGGRQGHPRTHGHIVEHLPTYLLAIGAPRQQGGASLVAHGAEHIGIDGHTVAQPDGDIALEQNIARQRHGTFAAHTAGLQNQSIGIEPRIAHPRCIYR